MIWDGLYVSIQPIPAKAAPVATAKAAPPAPTVSPAQPRLPSPVPNPESDDRPPPSPTRRPTPIAVAARGESGDEGSPPERFPGSGDRALPVVLAVVVAALAVIASLAGWRVGAVGRKPPGGCRR